jgi:UDP-N-acetylglucosamine--N-acetylmuramyl-(pentapeptide) pyrophosphoryl-undecaprenol N-acetylglucosamine transferase
VSRPIILAAGGTGGHVFPAQALAAELRARGRALALVTDRRGVDFGGALNEDEIHIVRASMVTGRGISGRVRGLGNILVGVLQARRLLRRLDPAGVVGFGGYASVPAVLAATQLGTPAVIHEQNAVLGRANRLLASRVRAIATSFPEVAQVSPADRGKVVHTGNPVRPAIAALTAAPYAPPEKDGALAILITGGSQGATVMAEVVPPALARLPGELRHHLHVTQQCRAETLERARRVYDAAGIAAELSPFIADMPARLAAAHLVICRAGASTIAELGAAGRPAILVPFPAATDDHQTVNARAFEQAGGGWLMTQPGFMPEILADRIAALAGRPRSLTEAAAAARAFGVPDAASRLADLVERRMPVNGGRGVNRAVDGNGVEGVAA